MDRVDCCVTTMDRPDALERLLLSIAEHRPGAAVHVADQSRAFDMGRHEALAELLAAAGLETSPAVHRLPFDCGVSAARNHLVESTAAEYKLILDDDFVFNPSTEVDAMARLLDAHPDVGVVGGSYTRNGAIRNFGTLLAARGDSLRQLPNRNPWLELEGVRVQRSDCVPMFALARGEVFERIGWDPALKTSAEHLDFYLRLSATPYGVLYAPEIAVEHPATSADADYQSLRMRGEFVKRMMLKHELKRIHAISGAVTELRPDGELIWYCELEPPTA